MRNRSLLCALLFCSMAHAQNWALLNPAYRYNYSNDGTDTISNQIRVMHVDTLGPDSFRYELNLIGVVCDTCPPPMFEPCDTCYVLINQPQFLGFECIQYGNSWQFNGPSPFHILPTADLGSSWLFDSQHGIVAIMDSQWPAEVFGTQDTLRRILLSNSDSLILSRSFGILRFHHTSDAFDLIGVEGAGVGRLFPDVLDYFDFQPGDELIYKIGWTCTVSPQGGSPYPWTCEGARRVVITARTETTNGVEYATSIAYASLSSIGSGSSFSTTWQLPWSTWVFDRDSMLAEHPILGSYPGQVLDTSICEYPWVSSTSYLVRHGITEDGRDVMFAPRLSTNGYYMAYHGFYDGTEPGPSTTSINTYVNLRVRYEERLGLVDVSYSYSPSGVHVKLIGAILGGDTLIQPPSINWFNSLGESLPAEIGLHPNPASQYVHVLGATIGSAVEIQDVNGRTCLVDEIRSNDGLLNIDQLSPGIYLLFIKGFRPSRLIIAR